MLLGVHTGGGTGAEHSSHSKYRPLPPTTEEAVLCLAQRRETSPCKGVKPCVVPSPNPPAPECQ